MDELRAIVELIEEYGWYAVVAISAYLAPRFIGLAGKWLDFGEEQQETATEAIKLATAVAKRLNQLDAGLRRLERTQKSLGRSVHRVYQEIRELRVILESTMGFNRNQAQTSDAYLRAMFVRLQRIEGQLQLIGDSLSDTQEISITESRPSNVEGQDHRNKVDTR